MIPLKEKLVKEFGPLVTECSFVNERNGYAEMKSFLDEMPKGGTFVEVGTFAGVGTAFIAQYVDKVVTFDIKPRFIFERSNDENRSLFDSIGYDPYEMCHKVWDFLGISHKIEERISDPGCAPDVSDLEFKGAFIDGEHSYEAVERDFNALRSCGFVLFHDYHKYHKGIKKFVNTLDNVTVKGKVALWKGTGR